MTDLDKELKELGIILTLLRGSAVEKHQLFYKKSPTCAYVKKSRDLYSRRDRAKILKRIGHSLKTLEKMGSFDE